MLLLPGVSPAHFTSTAACSVSHIESESRMYSSASVV